MDAFINQLKIYIIEIFPSLMAGFFVSGIINEFMPKNWVDKYLRKSGIKPIFFATLIGTLAPVCCWGSLPIAVSLRKKGASLGPIFAFLVATPATSISALFVAWKFLGMQTTVFIFFAVIVMGVISGLIGDMLKVPPGQAEEDDHEHDSGDDCPHCRAKKNIASRIRAIFKYAFYTMPKEIGLEIIIGLLLAALVSSIGAIGRFTESYLSRGYGFLFALVFGLVFYMCSTMSVPLVHAFITQGMNAGAGLSLLILGPIASFGTVLVIRKEFGVRVLVIFLGTISVLSILAGVVYNRLF